MDENRLNEPSSSVILVALHAVRFECEFRHLGFDFTAYLRSPERCHASKRMVRFSWMNSIQM